MKSELIKGAGTVSMFCRLNTNMKKELPIRPSEMGLLILICKSEQAVTPVMVADFLKVKKPMVTAMVASLYKHGYIEKIPSPDDKRSFYLNPTEAARHLVEDTYTEYIKTMELLWNRLGTKEFDNLMRVLEKTNTVLLEEKNHGK